MFSDDAFDKKKNTAMVAVKVDQQGSSAKSAPTCRLLIGNLAECRTISSVNECAASSVLVVIQRGSKEQ